MLESASRGGLPGLGGSAWSGGVSAWSGGCLPGLGGVCLVQGGLPGPGGWVPGRGGLASQHALRQTPPCGQTHTCKNITLATTSLRPVMMLKHVFSSLFCKRLLNSTPVVNESSY